MTTILLTSAGTQVKDEILKILPKPPNKIKVAHIITASKAEKNTRYVTKDKDEMIRMGFDVEDIDIEGKTEKDLMELLKNKDVICVQGGNTFYLLKAVKESDFEKVVKKLIEKGIIYIGISAGSYIACPTIEPTVWKGADRNTVGLTDFSAMNLVPFLLFVHYRPEHNSILKKYIPSAKYPVHILTDDQAILVKDNKITFVGKGAAVIIQSHGDSI